MMRVYSADGRGLINRQRNHQTHTHAVPPVKVSPIELLLLGSLRYLGRGITFDDVEESTFISRHDHRDFFHRFVAFGANKLYAKYVGN